MSIEVLDGVLSETLLNEIAEDLGIEPGVLRNSPFFRVIKGRVLLTYPLKVFAKQYEFIEIDLDGGASQVLAAGRYLVEHYTVAPGQTNMALDRGHIEFQKAAGWEDGIDVSTPGEGISFISDGVNVRYANGAAPGVHYIIAGVRTY